MTSPATDIQQHLTSFGFVIGGGGDFSTYLAVEPDAPQNTITFYDQSGGTPLTDQLDLFQVKVQVRVKCAVYGTGWEYIESIRDILQGIAPATMNGNVYLGWELESDIWAMGRNGSNQHILVANFQGIKQKG